MAWKAIVVVPALYAGLDERPSPALLKNHPRDVIGIQPDLVVEAFLMQLVDQCLYAALALAKVSPFCPNSIVDIFLSCECRGIVVEICHDFTSSSSSCSKTRDNSGITPGEVGMCWVCRCVFTRRVIVDREIQSRPMAENPRMSVQDSLASTENSQPVPRLQVRRFRSMVALGGCPLRSQANTTLTRPFGVLIDFPVVNA